MATDRDWDAYRTALVDLEPPGRPALRITPDAPGDVGTWPEGLATPLTVVTAWNPGGVLLADDVNAARHRILSRELATRGLQWWPAIGRAPDHGHAEAGAAVTGLSEEEARALGRRHGQSAVYLWTPEAWEVVSCVRDRRDTLGWRLTEPHGSSNRS